MQIDRRTLLAGSSAIALGGLPFPASAQEKVVKFGAPQDFTKVYTFVTAEYSQGQRDVFTLVNERGGINGHKIVLDVLDHGNDMPRAIEAYERYKREGYIAAENKKRGISKDAFDAEVIEMVKVQGAKAGLTY